MGATKKQIHSPEYIEAARIFKALCHPARIAIVDNILKNQCFTCKELCSKIDLAQSTISGHLKVLLDTGLLSVFHAGNVAIYQIEEQTLDNMIRYVKSVHPKFTLFDRHIKNPYLTPQPPIYYQSFVNNS